MTPDISFRTLTDARIQTDGNGLPRIMRTTRFAEAQIEWQGEQWLLAMPLTPSALHRIEHTISAMRRLNTPHLAQCRILPREMRWTDIFGAEQHTDLVLQHLPEGKDFTQALAAEEKQTLLAAADDLTRALHALGIAHNNLKEENLRWCGGRFVPIRYYDVRTDESREGTDNDAEALESIKRGIANALIHKQTLSDTTATYSPMRSLDGHVWTSHVFEGLVCVEDEDGFGFVDTDNNTVIEPQFVWAGDFRENRAEVQTAEGMGLIDRQGNYIIAPEYEIVDYDPARSIINVRRDGLWAVFDYMGRPLTEFRAEHPCEHEICM